MEIAQRAERMQVGRASPARGAVMICQADPTEGKGCLF